MIDAVHLKIISLLSTKYRDKEVDVDFPHELLMFVAAVLEQSNDATAICTLYIVRCIKVFREGIMKISHYQLTI